MKGSLFMKLQPVQPLRKFWQELSMVEEMAIGESKKKRWDRPKSSVLRQEMKMSETIGEKTKHEN